MTDTISVIIPAYNAERSILNCLDSICTAASGFDNIEIIVINDGSTDNTVDIIRQFILENKRNIQIYSKANGGVSSARNLGLKNASGKWIMFVDADDTINDGTFSILFNDYICKDRSNNSMLWMYSYEILNKNNVRLISLPNKEVTPQSILSEHMGHKDVFETTLCTIWNKVYNREVIKRYNISFPEDIKIGEDFIFNTKYLQHIQRIQFIPEPIYKYGNTEISAIDKFYEDYDYYISSMNNAYTELLKGLNNESPNANKKKSEFIAGRWLYATWMCVMSALRLSEKVKILQNWYAKIDEDLIDEISRNKDNPYSIIVTTRDSKTRIYLCVVRLIIKNYYDNMRKQIFKIKTKLQLI